ncbi:MAG TPA: hypothetical protein VMU51_23280 [Mycobacteriales bacterium]|nr:hypothetical protein [Mycobacteriales bacterium]
MNRRIVSSEDVVVGVDRAPDGYFDRVLKCIPVEVVTVYVVLASPAATAFDGRSLQWWLGLLLVGGLIAAPAYARSALAIRRLSQLTMTTAAFLVVVAATGGWFGTLDWWNGFFPLLASVLFGVTVAMLGFGPAHPKPPKSSPPALPDAVPAAREPGDDDPTEVVAAEAEPDESGLLRVWRGSDPPR